MMYGKMILVYAVVFIVLELLGMLCTQWKEEKNTIALNFIVGLFLAFAIFEILAIPCIFTYQKFHVFTGIYAGIILLLCAVSFVINAKKIKEIHWNKKKIPWIMVVAIILILFEMFMYVHYAHIDDDDAFFVATAVTTLEEDSMYVVNPYTGDAYKEFPARYVLSPFPIWNAFLSKVFAVHPTLFAHTFLPVILVLAAAFIYYLIGMELFEQDSRKTGYFLVFCTLIQMFSGYTRHPQGMVYLVRLWQGKAVLAAILLPACFYVAMRLFWKKSGWRDWLFCLILMISCCMVSSMGIMLGAISMGLLGILYAIKQKKFKNLLFTGLCCIPNAALAAVYLVIK